MGCRPWGCKELLDTTEHARQKPVARVSPRCSLHEKSMEGFIQSEVHLSGAFIPSVTGLLLQLHRQCGSAQVVLQMWAGNVHFCI